MIKALRKPLFIIIAGIVSAIIIVLFFVFQTFSPTNLSPQSQRLLTPTPVIVNTLPGGATKTNPPVPYNKEDMSKLINKETNRQPLSAQGQETKSRILSSLNNLSGRAYRSSRVSIDYIKSPDEFEAEISSTDISLAKQEAVDWMISQGFTRQDVCNLPLSFYLSPSTSKQLRNTNTVFSPLPDGC